MKLLIKKYPQNEKVIRNYYLKGNR